MISSISILIIVSGCIIIFTYLGIQLDDVFCTNKKLSSNVNHLKKVVSDLERKHKLQNQQIRVLRNKIFILKGENCDAEQV